MFIVLSLFTYFMKGPSFDFFVWIALIVIYFIVAFVEAKYIITGVRANQNKIIFDLRHFNNKQSTAFDKSSIQFDCFESSKGSMFSFYLKVKDGDGNKLTQYSVGYWNKTTLGKLKIYLEDSIQKTTPRGRLKINK